MDVCRWGCGPLQSLCCRRLLLYSLRPASQWRLPNLSAPLVSSGSRGDGLADRGGSHYLLTDLSLHTSPNLLPAMLKWVGAAHNLSDFDFSVQPKKWHCFDLRICCGGSRQCNGRLLYDGTSDAIFNYSNRSLFTYELCFNYADGMIITRLPFATHFQHLRKNYMRTDVLEGLCSRGTHR